MQYFVKKLTFFRIQKPIRSRMAANAVVMTIVQLIFNVPSTVSKDISPPLSDRVGLGNSQCPSFRCFYKLLLSPTSEGKILYKSFSQVSSYLRALQKVSSGIALDALLPSHALTLHHVKKNCHHFSAMAMCQNFSPPPNIREAISIALSLQTLCDAYFVCPANSKKPRSPYFTRLQRLPYICIKSLLLTSSNVTI